jgi:hypothetical protein
VWTGQAHPRLHTSTAHLLVRNVTMSRVAEATRLQRRHSSGKRVRGSAFRSAKLLWQMGREAVQGNFGIWRHTKEIILLSCRAPVSLVWRLTTGWTTAGSEFRVLVGERVFTSPYRPDRHCVRRSRGRDEKLTTHIPTSAEIKKTYIYKSIHPHVSMAQCLN